MLATEERERSGIWSTASGLFAGVRTEAARASAREAPLDVAAFLAGPHQLHVVSPSRHQMVSIPLVVGLIDEVVHATYDRHHDGARLLLALDELANVAPLPRLASIVSEGGGQGVLTLACLQDLSQARGRWGASAEGFLSLFPTTVVLPGIADRATLELLGHLAGRSREPVTSYQRGPRGRRSGSSTSWVERDRASVAELARGRPGYALGLGADKSMQWVRLTPAHRDPRFRPYLERSSARDLTLARAVKPRAQLVAREGPRPALAHAGGHARLGQAERGSRTPARVAQLAGRARRATRSRSLGGACPKTAAFAQAAMRWRRVGASIALEGAGEGVLVECRAPGGAATAPAGAKRSRSSPPAFDRVSSRVQSQLLAAIGVVTAPQRAVPLVESRDHLDAAKGAPRPPRGALRRPRGAATSDRARRRRAACAKSERASSTLPAPCGPRADEHVVVQVRLAVSVEPVGESDDARPIAPAPRGRRRRGARARPGRARSR